MAEFPLPIMLPARNDLTTLKADQAGLRKRARQDRVSVLIVEHRCSWLRMGALDSSGIGRG